jgi:hypothetical protein
MESNKDRLRTADLTDATWFKASASNGPEQDCVEATRISLDGAVAGMAVRDSKDPQGPVLRFSTSEWAAFLDAADKGEMNL